MTRTILMALAGLLVVGSAAAQAPVPGLRETCMPSIKSQCAVEALSGDRAAVRACMIKHFHKLTPECQNAMEAARAAQLAAKSSPAVAAKP
jgi:hypothetical protein